jgi:hypothetical protein
MVLAGLLLVEEELAAGSEQDKLTLWLLPLSIHAS